MEELNMSKQFTQEFKEEAVRYYLDHKELGQQACAKNLGISKTALSNWIKLSKANKGEVPTRGSDNYENDEAKENARLRKELRDTQDALEILKKAIGILGN
jgi:transposase